MLVSSVATVVASSLLLVPLFACAIKHQSAGSKVKTSLSMGSVEAITWLTNYDLDDCDENILVIAVNDTSEELELSVFAPPTKNSRVQILVLPTAANATCTIGKFEFKYLPSTYRKVLATVNIGCVANRCWEHADDSLTAFAAGSNEPAGGETWVKKGSASYVYYRIASAPPPPPAGAIAIKSGSVSVNYTGNRDDNQDEVSAKITIQSTVVQDGAPKSGVSVVYTITCPGEDPIVLSAVTSDANGIAEAKTDDMPFDDKAGNKVIPIDVVNFPTCAVSAAINDGTAVVIDEGQPASTQSGVALRISWSIDADIDKCNPVDTKVAIIGVHGDGRLKRVYNTGKPNVGDVNILILPLANTGVSCVIAGTTYTIDPNSFNNSTTAANMGCDALTLNCWQYIDNSRTYKVEAYKVGNEPARGEKWIKKTGNTYVFHIVQ
ncbi:MAG: hypothetical protein OYH77_05040 [Pseudomonadota bacterium]|nr:hypothetical protein [Pseudomonadota bacterium]